MEGSIFRAHTSWARNIGMRALGLGIVFQGLVACFSGGGVTGVPLPEPFVAIVSSATITTPNTSPFYSRTSSIVISGLCTAGYTVLLTGASEQSQYCEKSTYSFNVSNDRDSIYSYFVKQTNANNDVSDPAALVWVKKSSISKPVITTPATPTFLSSAAELTISGSCESGSTLSLAGDGVGSVICLNSQFSINLPKADDGDYSIQVTQTDAAGNAATSSILWKKLGLHIAPNNSVVPVATPQVFSAQGGSGSYTFTVLTNNSGGTFNSATHTYTTGTIAAMRDAIKVTDSLGVSAIANIVTVAAIPDHLEYATVSGVSQSTLVGTNLPLPLKVKVVDRYGNGISSYPLYFRVLLGDATITSSAFQLTDFNGEASVTVTNGFSYLKSLVGVSPFAATLPDVMGAGTGRLLYDVNASTAGHGTLGSYFTIGSNSNGLVSADLNADGISDLVVLNGGDPSIQIFLGLGGGQYAAGVKYRSICAGPNALGSGDFNGDGKLDFIITCSSSMTVAMQVFLGTGTGTIQSAINIPLDVGESIPAGLVVYDFDGDGKLDVATAMAGSGHVSFRYGLGNGTFTSASDLLISIGTSSLSLGDFDKDGRMDLVVLNSAESRFYLVRNTGSRTFSVGSDFSSSSPVTMTVGDFNGDSYLDVAAVNNSDSTVTIFNNDKAGGFESGNDVPVGGGVNAIAVADFDGDGKLDFVVSNGDDSTINIAWGQGTGSFSVSAPIKVATNPVGVSVADVNADGIKDILVIGNGLHQLQVIPGQGARVFGFQNVTDVNPVSGVAFDFNSDGKMDYAALSIIGKTIGVYNGDGRGLFGQPQTLNTGDNSSAMIGVDLRGNHRRDLITTSPNKSQIRVFLSRSDGTFDDPQDYTAGSNPTALAFGDFNRDKFMDVAIVNKGSNNVSILYGDGLGGFTSKTDFQVASAPSSIAVADLNNDHILDLVVTNQSSSSVSVLLGNTDGTFQTHVDYGVAGGPVAVAEADFDLDGNVDLAVTNTNDGLISILLGNGNGSFRGANNFSAGFTPLGLTIGDFNGDNKLDIAVANGGNFGFTVLTGNGHGAFNTSTYYDLGFIVNAVTLSDFNSDGAQDLVVLDGTNNKFHIWLGH